MKRKKQLDDKKTRPRRASLSIFDDDSDDRLDSFGRDYRLFPHADREHRCPGLYVTCADHLPPLYDFPTMFLLSLEDAY